MIRERIQDLNEYDQQASQTGAALSTFLLGAVAGAAVALLLAPQPGRESRTWLKNNARRLREGAGEKLGGMKEAVEDTAHTVREAVDSGKEVLRESVAAGRSAYSRVRSAAETMTNPTI
jgi:gas vesicle protein